ncbi:ComEA family DNA-binding protein [Rhodopila sp.]|jgi:DNA uptake protein ComE-like DNA-binding protein|uniref:ComEA family DNA-binding protein n=1 Tax=Rhodopila sp. TaxID=2480087 RepID=UPI002B861D98|nr:helix-hairpin-helix domain-containing protein [Rhodopila sp.]HVZ09170.1 helix-hairpin-helix domain-containing protein [Rhodopila sp.]
MSLKTLTAALASLLIAGATLVSGALAQSTTAPATPAPATTQAPAPQTPAPQAPTAQTPSPSSTTAPAKAHKGHKAKAAATDTTGTATGTTTGTSTGTTTGTPTGTSAGTTATDTARPAHARAASKPAASEAGKLPPGGKVDLNTATAEQLDALPQIGAARAKAILTERAKGPFKDWNDFDTRMAHSSVNAGVKAKIKDKVTF